MFRKIRRKWGALFITVESSGSQFYFKKKFTSEDGLKEMVSWAGWAQ